MKGNVLITGASSGIGWEMAELFARAGYRVVAVARNESKLNELQHQLNEKYANETILIVKDLVRKNAIGELVTSLQDQNLHIDVLFNNAGFGLYGPFLETDGDDELDMIKLNVNVLTHLTKLLLPKMVENKSGGVLNVASTASFLPGPLMAVYYATKAYVLSFSEAIANELAGTGVTITALCPGPTATGFMERANLGTSKLFEKSVMDVHTVAKQGFEGFIRGKTVVIPGLRNRVLASSVGLIPRNMLTKVVRRLQESRK
jgi:short-subunit dehydrogenase